MPPRRQGAAQPGAASSSGASTSNSALILPAPLRDAWEALPDVAEAMLVPPAAEASTPGRRRQARLTRAKAVQHLHTLLQLLAAEPGATAVTQLLANTAAAEGLLRLHAAALRGPECAGPPLANWQPVALEVLVPLLFGCYPLHASRNTLPVLRFVLALLRAHTLQALSRRLAAAGAVHESQGSSAAGGSSSGNSSGNGSAGGPGRADGDGAGFAAGSSLQSTRLEWIHRSIKLVGALISVIRVPWDSPRTSPTEESAHVACMEASLRAECAEEFARSLAESGLLEHAARALLLLQARGPRETLSIPIRLFMVVDGLWCAVNEGGSPTAVAHLETALSGPCVRTAVLVYGVGTLRVVDGGPSYGLPPALQTAGLALREAKEDRALDPVALRLFLRMITDDAANKSWHPRSEHRWRCGSAGRRWQQSRIRVGEGLTYQPYRPCPFQRASCLTPP